MSAIVPALIAARLRTLTPARVGLGRTGVSQQTRDLLAFQSAHAQARGAVYARLEQASVAAAIAEITAAQVLCLHAQAADRATYLQRPDLGRKLNAQSHDALLGFAKEHQQTWDLVLVVADGLSALAVDRHAAPVIGALWARVAEWRLAPVCVVEQGRVAIGDQIGETLDAQLAIVLIGERPGLSSPDSLGAYITWDPRAGRTDAERNCVSNIRSEGLSYDEAATEIAYYLTEARQRHLTGVGLKAANRQIAKG